MIKASGYQTSNGIKYFTSIGLSPAGAAVILTSNVVRAAFGPGVKYILDPPVPVAPKIVPPVVLGLPLVQSALVLGSSVKVHATAVEPVTPVPKLNTKRKSSLPGVPFVNCAPLPVSVTALDVLSSFAMTRVSGVGTLSPRRRV